jgi:type IV pilus assembly protein PilO
MDLGLEKYQAQVEKLTKLPRPARLGLAPALCAVVIGAYVWTVFLPARREFTAAREQQLQLHRRLAEVRAVAGNEAQVKEQIAQLNVQLKEALRQLPNDKELPGLLTDVSSLGKNAGLDFKSFRPGEESTKTFYAEVPIEIEFTGRYHDIARFFDDISRLPRIVTMGQMDIAIARESDSDTVLKVTGEATTFRFVDEETAPAPAGKPAGAPTKGGKS